jgi:hypothetical protein
MDRDQALAICFANLKGSKDKDLLAAARALQYLKGLPEYGSNAKVGRAVGVSGEIVREFLTLLSFPEEIQQLFEGRQVGLEHGRRLWQLARRRPELLEEVAEAMTDMTAMDSRHLVEYIVKHPELSVREAKRKLLESKTVREREFHVIALLSEEQYRVLVGEARKRGVAVDVLVSSIVQRWLGSGRASDRAQ